MKLFNNKIYNLIRTIIYVALAALLLVFVHPVVKNLKYFIGGLMMFYCLDGIIYCYFNYKKHYDIHNLYWNLVEFLIGFTLVVFVKAEEEHMLYAIVCVSWATWSILREVRELIEITEEFKEKITAIPNIIESLVVIALSITMIIEPTEHHALIHLYLLAVELLTKVLFPVCDNAYEHHKHHHLENNN